MACLSNLSYSFRYRYQEPGKVEDSKSGKSFGQLYKIGKEVS